MLFDGECALCNRAVQFVLDHEQKPLFHFAPLQSQVGRDYLQRHHLPIDDFNSYVVIENGTAYVKSRAVIKMAFHMGSIWRVLSYIMRILPQSLADGIYSFGFKRRIQWFGKNTQCRLLNPSQQQRFLDTASGFRPPS
jgi:predicted DCC family thiol-disulfide oxidoreductase YuxK